MRTRHVTLGIALLMLTSLVSKAEARELSWKARFSGSVVNTQSDTNGDGNKGGVTSTGIKGSLGSGTARVTSEFAFSGPGTCPNGNTGFNFTLLPGTGHGIFRFNSTGDLLFTEASSATICFDPITTIQFSVGRITLPVAQGGLSAPRVLTPGVGRQRGCSTMERATDLELSTARLRGRSS